MISGSTTPEQATLCFCMKAERCWTKRIGCRSEGKVGKKKSSRKEDFYQEEGDPHSSDECGNSQAAVSVGEEALGCEEEGCEGVKPEA